MKPAILALVIAAKLSTVAAFALAAVEDGGSRLDADPLTAAIASEPLSGGYRRKSESDEDRS